MNRVGGVKYNADSTELALWPRAEEATDAHYPSKPARTHKDSRAAIISAGEDVRVLGVANRMISYPSLGRRHVRAASLKTRLERLRTTAQPSLLAATKATRPGSPSLLEPHITILIRGWLYRFPCVNTCSKSFRDFNVLMREACAYLSLTVRRLRPLARRRASTARPPLVAIRARKP